MIAEGGAAAVPALRFASVVRAFLVNSYQPPKLLLGHAMRTLSISLPQLNPSASMRDSRQDEDDDNVPARSWLNPDYGGGDLRDDLYREGFKGQAGPLLRGAYMVVDAFATYRWDHGRNLWLSVSAQAMVVDVSNHSGRDPGGTFGDPCVITRKHPRESTSCEGALQATTPPGSTSTTTTRAR